MPHTVTRRQFIGTAVGTTALIGARCRGPGAAAEPALHPRRRSRLRRLELLRPSRLPDARAGRAGPPGPHVHSAYAAAPVCTPTACSFVTGRYPQRLEVGLREPLKDRRTEIEIGLPADHPTVASRLKLAGYDTALVGKWHLGWKPEFGPNRHGYDEFFGILSGAADYFTHSGDLWENLTPVERTGYLTDLLTDRAVQFIERRAVQPVLPQSSLQRAARAVGRPRGRQHRPRGSRPRTDDEGRLAEDLRRR